MKKVLIFCFVMFSFLTSFSQKNFNSWQCRRCGQVSRGTIEPSGGKLKHTCSSEFGHSWSKANTNYGGFQCRRCGMEDFIVGHKERDPAGPCCGEFGGCTDGKNWSHRWEEF